MKDLTADELEALMLAAAGFVVGLVLFVIMRELVAAWVVAQDEADRRRIHEELERYFATTEPDQLRREPAAVGSLTAKASRLTIDANATQAL